MNYFNTNHESGETLQKSEEEVLLQEKRVLMLFKDKPLPQHELRRLYRVKYERTIRVASCSRAFANLTKEGKLIKNGKDKMVMGIFHKMVHTWQRANL